MSYYSPNPHYTPDDFSENAERLERCEQEAARYFASVTQRQKAEFDDRMAFIRAWSGSPLWERQKAEAEKRWRETTTEARDLLDRTVQELMLTGEVSDDLSAAWDKIGFEQLEKAVDRFVALGCKLVLDAEQVPA